MSAIEFVPWGKISRLNRDIVVTEKIDGTNAAILITPLDQVDHIQHHDGRHELFEPDAQKVIASIADAEGRVFLVFAQSRTRFITPDADNFGFAKWVEANAEGLVAALGEGRHFGEWWGQGIQRGYGLKEKCFSLFNTSRWKDTQFEVPGLSAVPVLYWGPQSEERIKTALAVLDAHGSPAAARLGSFKQPAEGIVIWHTAGRTFSKVTLLNDEIPKGLAG
ncbi:MAG: RNA ligase family protein [Armatimonadia bacterium]